MLFQFFDIFTQQNYQLQAYIMSAVQQVQTNDIEKFVRSRVNHSFNKDVFEQELNDEIKKNLGRMQESIIKDMKRKMILKNQEQEDLQKRQRVKRQLQEKLSKSKQKREKQKDKRLKQQSQEKKFKHELFVDRLNKIKQIEKQKALQKLKELEEKDKIGGPKYNKLDRAISLIEEPHYKRKLQIDQEQYNRLKKIVDNKQAFKDTRLKKRQLSLSQMKPRQTAFELNQKQRINQMGQHLQKIDETRKKRQKLINERIKNTQFEEKLLAEQRTQRLKVIMQSQKKRQESIVAKLSKSGIQSTKSLKSSSSKLELVQPEAKNEMKGSIIYEQGEDRQKHSYRKQIKQQIRQYMLKQKQKLLNSK